MHTLSWVLIVAHLPSSLSLGVLDSSDSRRLAARAHLKGSIPTARLEHDVRDAVYRGFRNGSTEVSEPSVSSMVALLREVLESIGQGRVGDCRGDHCLELRSAPTSQPGGDDADVHSSDQAVDDAAPTDARVSLFRSASVEDWFSFFLFCVAFVVFDLIVMHFFPDTFTWHLGTVALMIVGALLFNCIIWSLRGRDTAFDWLSGYCLEWILSMDNLFVFHLIFNAFRMPEKQTHFALFVGIAFAIGLRMLFFLLMSSLLLYFDWFRYPFGALLIVSGVQAARADSDEDIEPQDLWTIKTIRSCLGSRMCAGYDGNKLLTCNAAGKVQVTPLLVVIFCIESSDLVFALDSVSAKVAQIHDPFTAFTSTAIAMFGLRSMFFIIADLVSTFDLLKYGLSAILILIGFELIFTHIINIQSGVMCGIIVGIFLVCILGSSLQSKLKAAGA